MFKPVESTPNFVEIEEKITDFWKKNKIFEKSISARPKDRNWTFLDGPPFVTGTPHYGSLLSSLPKDLYGRYFTMKGYRVRRVWGWDGHGLPIENKVEGELDIKRKRDIEEKVGVKKFIDECKKYVNRVSADWEWYIDRIGRWVDFENAYRTWDKDYMESVMWVFHGLYSRGYVYKGLRVSLYCPHCATPVSNFEVAMDADNYKDITESATTYKYQVKGEPGTYFLAWSTTPWNKIATPALAVNPKLIYVKVKQGSEYYILAKSTLKILDNKPEYKIVESYKGHELVGLEFVPHYDYYKVEKDKSAFIIVSGDFVTADEGTGIVTLAVYGEEDLVVMNRDNIQQVFHIDDEGIVKSDVPKFAGMYYLKANKAVNEDLMERGLVYRDDQYTHSVAHCWRCATRLFYNPQNAWYVDVRKLKGRMQKTNEDVNWYPKHFKHGRFLKSMESAPDWNISRSRYWGSPVPVWECECGEYFVPSSIASLEEASGQKVVDLHKPEIDLVTIVCKKCGKKAHRTPEVLDSWIEAGSASFAERHFPFNKDEKIEDFFPPDFIAEYTGQIRAWFYVLHVIGAALYDSQAFKNVSVTGVILGTDGRKMSKNFKNYPDPKAMLQKYGGDALRLYLLGSPVMRGEDILISEDAYRDQVRGVLLVLWNIYKFFVTYASVDGWDNSKDFGSSSKNILDIWILSRLNGLVKDTTASLDSYDSVRVITQYSEFIHDLSNWYIRRSRDRIGPSAVDDQDKIAFYTTCYTALTTLCTLMAPVAPFIAEEIYKNLTGDESIHLANWPTVDEKAIDMEIESEMEEARRVVEAAHALRREKGIKVRQPLSALTVKSPVGFSAQIESLIADEVNVLEVKHTKGSKLVVNFDFSTNPKLIAAGTARDIIRQIQGERKKIGTEFSDFVTVYLPEWPREHEEEIKRKALVSELIKSDEFKVERVK